MATDTQTRGASSDRLTRDDWLAVFVFALPVIGATLNHLFGG